MREGQEQEQEQEQEQGKGMERGWTRRCTRRWRWTSRKIWIDVGRGIDLEKKEHLELHIFRRMRGMNGWHQVANGFLSLNDYLDRV